MSRWDLEINGGELSFFGSSALTRLDYDGSDITWALTAGYQIRRLFGLSLTYQFIDTDIGRYDAAQLDFNFRF
ncbi:hypothetical protein [Halioxenophilus sp. WMMB6]|uniref:hypothetical protein n=1 Tax=Halioxenophilus sp. WMMB6 TaxID=3073815 RepID=UPI00295F5172|nr:hypothetical protein [Halioxenophilus sp. WMMB6]